MLVGVAAGHAVVAVIDPLRFEAAILSRTRSPMTSRSNWAIDVLLSFPIGRIERLGRDGKREFHVGDRFDEDCVLSQPPRSLPGDFLHYAKSRASTARPARSTSFRSA
jgi:hypothetical protein